MAASRVERREAGGIEKVVFDFVVVKLEYRKKGYNGEAEEEEEDTQGKIRSMIMRKYEKTKRETSESRSRTTWTMMWSSRVVVVVDRDR
jgi:hypothetical protein